MYDVTGVGVNRAYVPIAADVPDMETAAGIAAQFSARPLWSSVLVKDNDRAGLIAATYVNGKRQPA